MVEICYIIIRKRQEGVKMKNIVINEYITVTLTNRRAAQWEKAERASQFLREFDFDEWEWDIWEEAWDKAEEAWRIFFS